MMVSARLLPCGKAEGKRLMYKDPVAEREYIKIREQEKDYARRKQTD
jgi:hypothetical protein